MPHLDDIKGWIARRLPELLAEYKVPGAAIGVYAGGEVIDFAAGVLSHATGVEATTDSVFQIGSITKTWTATLVMQLADEGLLDLDATVVTYLKDFAVADADASKKMTVRQLLSHTAGFEGDIFTDTGTNDDCVEKYVETLKTDPQLFPPGEMFSYNNAGFCVLGRIVEVLRAKPFDQALRDHLFGPLGLAHAATDANSAILFRAAVGHLPNTDDPDGEPVPAPVWSLAKSNSPAGAMLAMSPRDLLAFARMHLNDGLAPASDETASDETVPDEAAPAGASDETASTAGATRVLSESAARQMREPQVTLPPLGLMGTHWGLGWEMFDWPGGPVIGHDGGTIGQSAFLRIVPGKDVAIALLTNGGNPIAVYFEVYRHLLAELANVDIPQMPVPPANPKRIDATRYAGTYENAVGRTTIEQDEDGRIWMTETPLGELAELVGQAERTELVPLTSDTAAGDTAAGDTAAADTAADGTTANDSTAGDTLIPVEPKYGIHIPQVFTGDDGSGRALYIHSGRATRRAD